MHELTAQDIEMVAGGTSSLANLFGSIGTLLLTPAVAAYNAVVSTNAALGSSLASGSLTSKSVVTAIETGITSGITTTGQALALVPSGSAGLTTVLTATNTAISKTISNLLGAL
jgi:hypothetical protein